MEENNVPIDWEKIIISLHAYALSIVRSRGWFRGSETKTFIEGKEVSDYVFESIGRYLKYPEKFDKKRGTLINYLKFNLIRSLVSNDLTGAENRYSTDNSLVFDFDEEEGYQKQIEPFLEAFFDEEMDYQNVMEEVKSALKGDQILETIFNGLTEENLKRSEIIEHYMMSEKDYDNGARRLKTILKKIAKEFNLKN